MVQFGWSLMFLMTLLGGPLSGRNPVFDVVQTLLNSCLILTVDNYPVQSGVSIYLHLSALVCCCFDMICVKFRPL